jgi:hypothetical protein
MLSCCRATRRNVIAIRCEYEPLARISIEGTRSTIIGIELEEILSIVDGTESLTEVG